MIGSKKLAVVGLGYVGLPLAICLSQKFEVVGFDIDEVRVEELSNGVDKTGEVEPADIGRSNVFFTSDIRNIDQCDPIIICLPTPISCESEPDMSAIMRFLEVCCAEIDIYRRTFVFESTVFPGATRDVFGSKITELTSLTLNEDYFLGYSPERINPGGSGPKLEEIVKIVAGSNEETLARLVDIYSSVIQKVVIAESLEYAEAAKVIENAQRDVNIAFMNDLSQFFQAIDLRTDKVLELAATKWNFINFKPGLVGGHCIGVDPYYLIWKAEQKGIDLELIQAARKINENVKNRVIAVIDALANSRAQRSLPLKVLFCGLTFKENCPDFRNSMALEICSLLASRFQVSAFDPFITEKGLGNVEFEQITSVPSLGACDTPDVIIFAVAHQIFLNMAWEEVFDFCKADIAIVDLVGVLPHKDAIFRL